MLEELLEEEGGPDLAGVLAGQKDYARFWRLFSLWCTVLGLLFRLLLRFGQYEVGHVIAAQTSPSRLPLHFYPLLFHYLAVIGQEVYQFGVAVGRIGRKQHKILLVFELDLELQGVVNCCFAICEFGLVVLEVEAIAVPPVSGLLVFSH